MRRDAKSPRACALAASWVLLGVLSFAPRVAIAQAPPAQAEALEVTKAERDGALRLDPRELPRGVDGAWAAWGPATPPPEAVRATFVAGVRAYQEGDYAAALAHLHVVLRRTPDHPGALYQAATAYFRLRRYGDCAALAERFLAAAPTEIGATQVLGHAYYTLGEYERALEHYGRVVAASPKSAEAWRGLGLARLRLGDPASAVQALDKALELRPQHGDALVWRAQALIDLGATEQALEAALRGRDLGPFEPRAWFVLGEIFATLGRDSDSATARARFVELSRIDQQVRAQEALLLVDPRALDPRVRLVRLHVLAGDRESVRENIVRLERLAPELVDVELLALEAFAALADHQAAEQVVAQIEKRFAAQPSAWAAIESYWRSRGDEDRARRAADRRKALGRAER